MTTLTEFDKPSIIQITLFLQKNPHSNITKIINHIKKQRATYTALDTLINKEYLNKTQNPTFPYNPIYTLTPKGEQLANILTELQNFLEQN